MIEVRLSPQGYSAQLVPPNVIRDPEATGRKWLCMSWEDGTVRASVLTDEDVADWRVLHRDESWTWGDLGG